jgi:hypothetical protein
LIPRARQRERIVAARCFDFVRAVDAHRDIRRLFVDRHAHAARFGVEADGRLRVADVGDRLAHDLGDVDVGR